MCGGGRPGELELNVLAVLSDVGWGGRPALLFSFEVCLLLAVGVCLCYWIDTGCLRFSACFLCSSMRACECVCGHGLG